MSLSIQGCMYMYVCLGWYVLYMYLLTIWHIHIHVHVYCDWGSNVAIYLCELEERG